MCNFLENVFETKKEFSMNLSRSLSLLSSMEDNRVNVVAVRIYRANLEERKEIW